MSKIGRYEVETEISRGAMGVVYLARDPRLHRRIALKTFHLPEGFSEAQKQEYQERFLREARSAAGLSHQGIITVYDVDWDPDSGAPYIAMEYVPGRSLKDRLQAERRLEPEQAFAMTAAIADALACAHRAGIVHRDIKPANVLIRDPDGAIKIADFGVARCSTSELTRTGATLGSPAHMSPEQIQGHEVDGRSDLFSLGVILYQSLCGERPFQGDDMSTLAYTIVHTKPEPITRRVSGLPVGLDCFFERALAKKAELRFPDAHALRWALEEACRARTASTAVEAHPQKPPRPPEAYPADSVGGTEPGCFPESDEETDPAARWNIPVSTRVLAALLLALLAASWIPWIGAPRFLAPHSRLKLEGLSRVASGRLELLVDGEQVYSRHLATGGDRGSGKALLAASSLREREAGEQRFEAWVPIPPGRHEVKAQLTAAGDSTLELGSVIVEVGPGETGELRLVAGPPRDGQSSLQLD